MSQPPLVSVVIATNRGGPYLDEAVGSVTRQTYPHHEIVVVDDGAPDPAALDTLAERYEGVRVVHQPASGVSVARNLGVTRSSGELVAFLDDDDLWPADRLTAQVAALAHAPGAVLAYGRVGSIDSGGRPTAPADQGAARTVREVFDGTATPMFQGVTMRRDAFGRVGGFRPGLRFAEDLDLLLRLARQGSFVFVDREVARYRNHGGNVTRDFRALAESIDAVARLHQAEPGARQDGTARSLRARRARNRRFALWSAAGAARSDLTEHRYRAALGQLAWGLRFAPDAPARIAWRRFRRMLGTPPGD